METVENTELEENIFPTADWTIGAFIDKMVKNNSRMAGKRATEKAEWLIIDLYMEYTRRKYNYAKILDFDGEGLNQIERYVTTHKEYYQRQCSLIKTFSCKLFEVGKDKFEDIMSVLILTKEDSFLKDKIPSLERGKMRKATEFSAMDRLRLKFRINSTALMEKRVVSALKSILPRGAVKFAEDSDVIEKKYSLKVPSIKMLKNPTGNSWGRYCSLSEVHQSIYLDTKIVPHLNFFFGNIPHPMCISINHSDGAKQTESVGLFDSVQRIMNFGDAARNPAELLPLVLEQGKELRNLMVLSHGCSKKEAIANHSAYVRCLSEICLL